MGRGSRGSRRAMGLAARLFGLTAALVLLGVLSGGGVHAANPPDNTITVQGDGVISAAPDTAVVRLGVSVQAQTVAGARSQAAAGAQAVIAAVEADGVAEQDIQTVQLSISPQYNSVNNQQVLVGYRADNVLQIKVRALQSAGQVIDDAVAAGGNNAVVQGISFTIDDPSALAHQARMLAIQDAHTKAADYAAAVGLSLGRVVQITEESSPAAPPVPAAAPVASVAFTPVQGGTLQIRVVVTVSYLLQ